LPQAGEELTISYGDKGNEELLLLYGFAQRHNPHESLMLLCPLPPPEEWDEVFGARMQLLQVRVCVWLGRGVQPTARWMLSCMPAHDARLAHALAAPA
jgi:hypothetical protein